MNSQLEFIKGSTIIGLGCSGMNRREQKKISFGGVEEGLSVKGAGGFRDFGFGWHE